MANNMGDARSTDIGYAPIDPNGMKVARTPSPPPGPLPGSPAANPPNDATRIDGSSFGIARAPVPQKQADGWHGS